MANHQLSFNMMKMTPVTELLAEPSKIKPWPIGLRRMAVLSLACVLTFVGPRREASADTPAVVLAAELAAVGAVAAATVAGVATVVAAGIIAKGNITAAEIRASGDNPPLPVIIPPYR